MFIKIKVKTESKKELIEKINENTFNIWVKEEAKKNFANKKIIELLKKEFNTNNIRLISGHTSPSKIFEIN